MKKFIIITIVIVLVGLAAMFAFVKYNTSGVEEAADAVMAKLNTGQYEEVYRGSLMANEFTLAEFEEAMGIGQSDDITKGVRVDWYGTGFSGDEKYIYGSFLFPDNSLQMITFWFMDEQGEFILSGITSGEPDDYYEDGYNDL